LLLSLDSPFLRTSLEAIQVACIGWVLLHLLLLIMNGTVVIVERSKLILAVETAVVAAGLSASGMRFLSTVRGKKAPL